MGDHLLGPDLQLWTQPVPVTPQQGSWENEYPHLPLSLLFDLLSTLPTGQTQPKKNQRAMRPVEQVLGAQGGAEKGDRGSDGQMEDIQYDGHHVNHFWNLGVIAIIPMFG